MVTFDESTGPLLAGFAITREGITPLNWETVSSGEAAQQGERRWLHLNRNSQEAREWLVREHSVEGVIANALFATDTRPRLTEHGSSLLINLRGANFNRADPTRDMISVRMWVSEGLIITSSAQKTLAMDDLRAACERVKPPASQGEFITYVAERLTARMEPVVDQLVDNVLALEARMLEEKLLPKKTELAAFRRSVLALRRYMSPQREALSALARTETPLLSASDRLRLRESHDVVTRLAEDLDNIRERAEVIQEQIIEVRAEAMNQRLFLLAVVSAIFLPLSFITGLFGVNVGGMPGVESALAFGLLCLFCALLTLLLLVLFHKKGWW